jgi:hypothetical protein
MNFLRFVNQFSMSSIRCTPEQRGIVLLQDKKMRVSAISEIVNEQARFQRLWQTFKPMRKKASSAGDFSSTRDRRARV